MALSFVRWVSLVKLLFCDLRKFWHSYNTKYILNVSVLPLPFPNVSLVGGLWLLKNLLGIFFVKPDIFNLGVAIRVKMAPTNRQDWS